MQRRMFLQSVSAAALAAPPAPAAQAGQGVGAPIPPGAGSIALTEKEYFEGPGFIFLVFHNNYSGMQGGLEMILNGERLLDSGGVLLTGKNGSGRTSARVLRRVADRDRATATVIGEATELKLGYQLICRADGERMVVTLKFDGPLDWSKVREAGFQIFLYPPAILREVVSRRFHDGRVSSAVQWRSSSSELHARLADRPGRSNV